MAATATNITSFANNPNTTVATNGYNGSASHAGTPSSGTGETWTVTSSTGFPATSAGPPTVGFHIANPALPNELILVTGISGTTWTVTRGVESTTTYDHAANATFYQVVSAGDLQNFKQTPQLNTTTAATVTSTTETVLATYTPPSTDLVAGTVWEIIAFGPMSFNSNTSATHPVLTFNIYWGGSGSVNGAFTATGSTKLAFIKTGTNSVAFATMTTLIAGSSWDLNASIALQTASSTHTNMNLYCCGLTANSLAASNITAQTCNTGSTGIASSTAISISSSTTNVIFLTGLWTSAVTSQSFTAVGQTIYRLA